MNPDIQDGLSPILIGTLATIAVSIVGGGLYFLIPNFEEASVDIRKFDNAAIPSNYFDTPKAVKPIKEPKPEVTDAVKAKRKSAKNRTSAKNRKSKKKVKLVPYQAHPPRPSQLELRRAAFNAARLGSSISLTSISGNISNGQKWENSQEDYSDQGLLPNEASFPVDLTRTITADRNISAVLFEEINSEKSGKITALIDHNIYASHGRNILIPAGSKAIGLFASTSAIGDRVIIAKWHRIITPEGINIILPNASVADQMGRIGLDGDIDNRIMERFGAAMLVSTISAVGQMNVPVNNQQQQIAVNELSSEMSQVSAAVIQQNLDLKPIITIPAGKLIKISIMSDIWFKKPEKNTVIVQRK